MDFSAVWQNLWVKMALSSSGRASPLRVATGGDASWRLEARRRRSPARCLATAWGTGRWAASFRDVGSFALFTSYQNFAEVRKQCQSEPNELSSARTQIFFEVHRHSFPACKSCAPGTGRARKLPKRMMRKAQSCGAFGTISHSAPPSPMRVNTRTPVEVVTVVGFTPEQLC